MSKSFLYKFFKLYVLPWKASIPLRFAASSIKSLHSQFATLSNRHNLKLNRDWKPPNILRRKRAAILAGSKPEEQNDFIVEELEMDEEINFMIDEGDENIMTEEKLEAALNEAKESLSQNTEGW